jgi:hypothetical protein
MNTSLAEKLLQQSSLNYLIEDFRKHHFNCCAGPKQKVKTNISFQELARLQILSLANQKPHSLSEKRAQTLHTKMNSYRRDRAQNDEEIKYNLRMYFPALDEQEIIDGLNELYRIFNEPQKYN